MRKRKRKAISADEAKRISGRKEIDCHVCSNYIEIVSEEVSKYTCPECVQKMVAPPPSEKPKSETDGFPRGWHLKKLFISNSGKYYSKGIEITKKEADEITNATKDLVKDVPKQKTKDKKVTKTRAKKSKVKKKIVKKTSKSR